MINSLTSGPPNFIARFAGNWVRHTPHKQIKCKSTKHTRNGAALICPLTSGHACFTTLFQALNSIEPLFCNVHSCHTTLGFMDIIVMTGHGHVCMCHIVTRCTYMCICLCICLCNRWCVECLMLSACSLSHSCCYSCHGCCCSCAFNPATKLVCSHKCTSDVLA